MNWENREKVSNEIEAMEVIADFISSSQVIRSLIRKRDQKQLDEAEQFAHKWGVPFDKEFVVRLLKHLDTKRWDGDEQLVSEEDIEMYIGDRSYFDSDEEYEEEKEYYRSKRSHYWMTSSETSLCD